MLAGVSADYYLRLERGRDRHPSSQVLESIARVLQLDDEHLTHLLSLVDQIPRQARQPQLQDPPNGALKLLDTLTQPAFIEDRYLDIVASNREARALSPYLVPGGNQLRDLFLNPDVQAMHLRWEDVAECFVASLRQAVGKELTNPRLIELTDELSRSSDHFRQLWARHEVRQQSGTLMHIQHPQAGTLVLNRERLSIGGADGLLLVVYHADAGSATAEQLAMLTALATDVDAPDRRRLIPTATPM